jgi:hypothetical protein
VKGFVIAEAVFGICYVGGAWLGIPALGAEGATLAYLAAAAAGLVAAALCVAFGGTEVRTRA